jgi:hypothetical protein
MKQNKLLYILVFLSFLTNCKSQTTEHKFYSEEFKWTITIPSGFEKIETNDWKEYKKKGIKAIEETFDKDMDDRTRTIFSFKNGEQNILESVVQPYDVDINGEYLETQDYVNKIMYQTIKKNVKGAKIDTLSFNKTISGKEFVTFKMTVTYPNNLVMNTLMYSRLFDKTEFTVNITYIDEKVGKKMIEKWENSVFE